MGGAAWPTGRGPPLRASWPKVVVSLTIIMQVGRRTFLPDIRCSSTCNRKRFFNIIELYKIHKIHHYLQHAVVVVAAGQGLVQRYLPYRGRDGGRHDEWWGNHEEKKTETLLG